MGTPGDVVQIAVKLKKQKKIASLRSDLLTSLRSAFF
jgi:hypothetical protein